MAWQARFLGMVFVFTSITVSADVLPTRLAHLHSQTIVDQRCQPNWTKWLAEVGFKKITISSYTTLYLIPCAEWSTQLTWAAYLEFNEPQSDGHGLFRSEPLAGMDMHRHLVGVTEIYDGKWDAENQQLTSTYSFDGGADCGIQQVYQWDADQLQFDLSNVTLKTTCDGLSGAWPTVFP